MKKIVGAILFLMIAILASGCDPNPSGSGQNEFSPPEWIWGTWVNGDTIVTFTSDNIIYATPTMIQNFSEDFGNPAVSRITETVSTAIYEVTVADTESPSFGTYRFVYDTEDTLNFTLTIPVVTLGPWELVRH